MNIFVALSLLLAATSSPTSFPVLPPVDDSVYLSHEVQFPDQTWAYTFPGTWQVRTVVASEEMEMVVGRIQDLNAHVFGEFIVGTADEKSELDLDKQKQDLKTDWEDMKDTVTEQECLITDFEDNGWAGAYFRGTDKRTDIPDKEYRYAYCGFMIRDRSLCYFSVMTNTNDNSQLLQMISALAGVERSHLPAPLPQPVPAATPGGSAPAVPAAGKE